jgi:phosphohistidine phosphatase
MSAASRDSGASPALRHTIYLVRHAIAAERGDEYPDDSVRPLTEKGAEKMREVARGLADLCQDVDLVLTSPFARAHSTADILVEALRPEPRLEVMDELAPGYSAAEVADALGRYAETQSIALVGHEPDLGTLAAWLIGARQPLPFKKGGAARIDVAALPPGRNGELRWLATPRMLRAIK